MRAKRGYQEVAGEEDDPKLRRRHHDPPRRHQSLDLVAPVDPASISELDTSSRTPYKNRETSRFKCEPRGAYQMPKEVAGEEDDPKLLRQHHDPPRRHQSLDLVAGVARASIPKVDTFPPLPVIVLESAFRCEPRGTYQLPEVVAGEEDDPKLCRRHHDPPRRHQSLDLVAPFRPLSMLAVFNCELRGTYQLPEVVAGEEDDPKLRRRHHDPPRRHQSLDLVAPVAPASISELDTSSRIPTISAMATGFHCEPRGTYQLPEVVAGEEDDPKLCRPECPCCIIMKPSRRNTY